MLTDNEGKVAWSAVLKEYGKGATTVLESY